MNVLITVYELATGRVLRSVTCQFALAANQCEAGEGFVFGDFSGETHYVKYGGALERPANPTTISATTIPADGETLAVLQAVAGMLTIIGPSGRDEYEVPDGPVELAFDTPGEYTLRLEAFPHLPFEAVIHAY